MIGALFVTGLLLALASPSLVIACRQRRYYTSWREWLRGSAQFEKSGQR